MLNLLTCTGSRAEAWFICQQLMAAQTYAGPVRWVIVDDGMRAQHVQFCRPGWDLVVLRPEPFWSGTNTQHRNMLAGLAVIPRGEPLAFIEDDDYYAPDWLETVVRELAHGDLVGQVPNKYYNVRSGQYHQCTNTRHSSLCSSAIKGLPNYDVFERQCHAGRKLVDIQLWKHCQNRHTFGGDRVIGMKAMPGRAGIAGGHDMPGRPLLPDLRDWIGKDAALYEGFRETSAP